MRLKRQYEAVGIVDTVAARHLLVLVSAYSRTHETHALKEASL